MKHLALLIATGLIVSACSPASQPAASGPDTATAAGTPAAATAPATSTAAPSAEDSKILASLPAPYNEGNLDAGRREFAKCKSCHVIEAGAGNRVGPNLHGLFGRKAGALEGFQYSDAVKNAGFVWDAGQLDSWLKDPKGFLPGNRMSFVGVKDEIKRRDLIAYIKVESQK
jgi:cytochrome c